jgi:hypothetical protein
MRETRLTQLYLQQQLRNFRASFFTHPKHEQQIKQAQQQYDWHN